MTNFLTREQIDGMSPHRRAIYAKEQQIAALEKVKISLQVRWIPEHADAADLEDAIGDLEIELSPLRAEYEEIVATEDIITPITTDQVEALKQAINELSGVITATASVASLLTSARMIANRLT
jgi:hypothetical protein